MSDDTPVSYPESLADAALRRAAQLQAEAAERIERQALVRASDNRLTSDELLAIAREAGIADEYLKLALAEVEQQGELELARGTDDATLVRWLGSKRRSISVARRFPAPIARVLAAIPVAFESDDFRLRYEGQSGGSPLEGGVLRFRMPRLIEMLTTRGTYTQLCYRLEQLEIWTLQVTVHDFGAHTEVVIYGDLRRGADANVRLARWFTGGLGVLGFAGVAALCVGLGMGALALVPALAAGAGSAGATKLGYRASYDVALTRAIEQLERLLDEVQRRIDVDALSRGG